MDRQLSSRPGPGSRAILHFVALYEHIQHDCALIDNYIDETCLMTDKGELGAQWAGNMLTEYHMMTDIWKELILGYYHRHKNNRAGVDLRNGNYAALYQNDVAFFVGLIKKWYGGGKDKYFGSVLKAVKVKSLVGWRPPRAYKTGIEAHAMDLHYFDIESLANFFSLTSQVFRKLNSSTSTSGEQHNALISVNGNSNDQVHPGAPGPANANDQARFGLHPETSKQGDDQEQNEGQAGPSSEKSSGSSTEVEIKDAGDGEEALKSVPSGNMESGSAIAPIDKGKGKAIEPDDQEDASDSLNGGTSGHMQSSNSFPATNSTLSLPTLPSAESFNLLHDLDTDGILAKLQAAILESSGSLAAMAARSVKVDPVELKSFESRSAYFLTGGLESEKIKKDFAESAQDQAEQGKGSASGNEATGSGSAEGSGERDEFVSGGNANISGPDRQILDFIKATGMDIVIGSLASARLEGLTDAAKTGRLYDLLQLVYYITAAAEKSQGASQYAVGMVIQHIMSQSPKDGYLCIDWEKLYGKAGADLASDWNRSMMEAVKNKKEPSAFLGFAAKFPRWEDLSVAIQKQEAAIKDVEEAEERPNHAQELRSLKLANGYLKTLVTKANNEKQTSAVEYEAQIAQLRLQLATAQTAATNQARRKRLAQAAPSKATIGQGVGESTAAQAKRPRQSADSLILAQMADRDWLAAYGRPLKRFPAVESSTSLRSQAFASAVDRAFQPDNDLGLRVGPTGSSTPAAPPQQDAESNQEVAPERKKSLKRKAGETLENLLDKVKKAKKN